jgi:hypothetical protein
VSSGLLVLIIILVVSYLGGPSYGMIDTKEGEDARLD